MKKIYRSLCVSAVLVLISVLTYAQQRVITGTVKDPAGGPLPGVNVLIKGTTNGTATDSNGTFSITAGNDDVLTISFIGYATEEVAVGNQTSLAIIMTEDVTTLGEVIVVGYGVQKKALNTGANLQVKGEDLQRLSTINALQALQGQAAGVQITSTSGQPGEPLKVLIRGIGTIGNSEPLYVVDGVLTDDISYLNNGDIESITVLKDAASAAIYGSQAGNGVVLVTTRTGKSGSPARITFDAFYGFQNPARKAEMLNAPQYATIMNEAAVNSGKLPYFSNEQISALDSGTNWIDEMFIDNAVTQNYSFGASGGSASSIYSISLAYQSQEGIVGGKSLSNYDRYNFRINSEHKLYEDKVKVGQHLTFAHVDNNGIGVGDQYNNTLRGAFNTSPFVPMYDSKGNFWDNSLSTWNPGEGNPYAQMVLNNQCESNNQRLLGDLYLEAEPVKNLKYRSSLGLDLYSNESHSFSPIYKLSVYAFRDFTSVDQSMGKGRTWIWDNLLTYGLDLNEEHHFDIMAGTAAYQFAGTYISGNNRDLVFSDLEHAWLNNATNTEGGGLIGLQGKPDDDDRRLSYFGRLNYNFNETYLFNATFRRDGSSKFSRSTRWGNFPSVSVGWVISNAPFMQSTQRWMNSLKLRASWGQVGSQAVPAYQYMGPVTFANTNYIFGNEEGILTPGAYPSRLANPNLKWETSEQTNIGLDSRFMEDRLNVSLDWYIKTTKDWIINAPILATAGADAPYINGGDVRNTGLELSLNYNNSVGELNYSLAVNGAYNKNRVGRIPNQDGIVHGETNQLFNNSLEFNRAQNGFPIGYFWGLETNGIFQTEQEVAGYTAAEGQLIQPNAKPGDVRYIDRNDDGLINDLDRTIIGDPNPDYTFGFTISANYRGFDFSLLANGVAGNEIVQSYRNQADPYANYTTAIFDRWHGPGSSNTIPRVTEDNRNWINFSDLYIHKGDFLRISNLTLGYDFANLLNGKVANQVRLYASALNLFTFTKYEGMDPEIGYGVDSFSSGIDLGYYPRPRTFLLGLNVKF